MLFSGSSFKIKDGEIDLIGLSQDFSSPKMIKGKGSYTKLLFYSWENNLPVEDTFSSSNKSFGIDFLDSKSKSETPAGAMKGIMLLLKQRR